MKFHILSLISLLSWGSATFAGNSQIPFLDLDLVDKFSDQEQVKLFKNIKLGRCYLEEKELIIEDTSFFTRMIIQKKYKNELKKNQINFSEEKKYSDKVIAASLRALLKDHDCGTFSEQQIKDNKTENHDLLGIMNIGFNYFISQKMEALELAHMHYPLRQLINEHKLSVKELRKAGYSFYDMTEADITLEEIVAQGYTAQNLLDENYPKDKVLEFFSLKDLKEADFSPKKLKDLGFNLQQIKDAGYTLNDFLSSQFDLKKELASLYSLDIFKLEGFSARQLREEIKANVIDLKQAGFTLQEIIDAGFDLNQEIKMHFNLIDFKTIGFTAKMMKDDLKYSAWELRLSGYSKKEILDAGYSLEEYHK